MTESDEERQLRIDLMKAQIDHKRLDLKRIEQQMRWEPLKAIATILAAVAAVAGIILGVAHVIR